LFLLNELNATQNQTRWWDQFPPRLRLIAKGRLWASIGAGGVLYLSPLLFNELGFSGSQIGSGITIAALSGTLARFITGIFLDKGVRCSVPLKIAAIFAIISDFLLFHSHDYESYLHGQFFLGTAAGIYWPAAELIVPISCQDFPSSKGFALVRTADALGICIGSFLGTAASWLDSIRFIYFLDFFCMVIFLITINKKLFEDQQRITINKNSDINNLSKVNINNKKFNSFKLILPILFLSLYATSILSLLQSGLPFDLLNGGTNRPPLNETLSGLLITVQLILLLVLQWPIGNWLSNKDIKFGLKLSLISLLNASLLLAISSSVTFGLFLVSIALILIAIGLTSFLPTATEAIVKLSNHSNKGITMAMFSQCFGISSIIAPITAGKLIDYYGNGIILWISMSIIAILLFPLVNRIIIED
tara:strand:+ start:74866 stop:76122 length:1257 start_codon:yes stop_codon:yes gene_type:complete